MIEKKKNDFLVELRKLSATQGVNTVFTTLLELMASGLAAHFDSLLSGKMHNRVEIIMASLSPEVNNGYARLMLQCFFLISIAKKNPTDILGGIYHELCLSNDWNGQYFTPDDIGRTMAMVNNIADSNDKISIISDSACGSGALLIARAWHFQNKGVDYSNCVLFKGTDIDIRCVWMAYIQCCLYDMPAVIIHGNSITGEEWSKWHTYNYLSVMQKKIRDSCTGEVENFDEVLK